VAAGRRDHYSVSGELQPDVKEVVGTLLRALGNAEISEQDVLDLGFDAEGELGIALEEAFILLLQFAQDIELRRGDAELDRKERADLQRALDRIVALYDGAAA
jgi:hypothetical protein